MTKQVCFTQEENTLNHQKGDHHDAAAPQQEGDEQCVVDDLWYSNAEVEASRRQVKMAGAAVNDACGDFDVTDDKQVCIQAILRKQAENKSAHELAATSRDLSAASVDLSRLYALVLEKEVGDIQAVSYEAMLLLVNEILIAKDEDEDEDTSALVDENDDDSNSVGTIEELPCTEGLDEDFITDIDFGDGSDNQEKASPDGGEPSQHMIDTTPTRRSSSSSTCSTTRRSDETSVRGERIQKPFFFPLELNSKTPSSTPSNVKSSSSSSSSSSYYYGMKTFSKLIESDRKKYATVGRRRGGGGGGGDSSLCGNKKRRFPTSSITNSDFRHHQEAAKQDDNSFSFSCVERRVRRKTGAAAAYYEQETKNRCNVAHALISLARWEFRGYKVCNM